MTSVKNKLGFIIALHCVYTESSVWFTSASHFSGVDCEGVVDFKQFGQAWFLEETFLAVTVVAWK